MIVLVTGASSGFGEMTARALARAGHTVHAGMRAVTGRNADKADAMRAHAKAEDVKLRPLDLDVVDDASVSAAVKAVLAEDGRIDAVVHNAGHMAFGPAESFTPEQLAELYDVNVLGAHRLNRAVLPHLRARGTGLLVWVSSTSVRGGTTPWLGPYFAAKAGMDSLAVTYAGELARWGIETAIVVPGAFTKGTQHFAHAAKPADDAIARAYDAGPCAGVADACLHGLASLEPEDADPQVVATEIVRIVGLPHGQRPFRTHVDPSDDGSAAVSGVADRVRAELLRRIGLADLLAPRARAR